MPFTGKPEMHKRNHGNARKTYARAAHIDGPEGREPAVGIFRGNFLLTLLPVADALRLSNQIVDAAERHEVHA